MPYLAKEGSMENLLDRIEIDPEICHGQPCIRGTRILVSVVLRLAEEGLSFAQIREEYPELADADIQAAIQYARLTVEDEEVYPLRVRA